MKKYIFFVFLFILLLFAMSYYEKQQSKKELSTTNIKMTKLDSFLLVINSPDYLISLIEASKQIEDEYIGFEAKRSYICNSYEKLLDIVSDSLWVELSYSESPVMRYYACRALFSKESNDFSIVRDRLKKDTTPICFQSFDVFYYYTLGELIELASKQR